MYKDLWWVVGLWLETKGEKNPPTWSVYVAAEPWLLLQEYRVVTKLDDGWPESEQGDVIAASSRIIRKLKDEIMMKYQDLPRGCPGWFRPSPPLRDLQPGHPLKR